MEQYLSPKALMSAITFSVLGIVVLMSCFVVFDKFTPGNFWKEILEEHNTALAIVVGAITLAMAMIVSAAIHG